MEQDTEYQKLPLEERLAHKSWRARLHGYEECVKTFQCIDDEKSPEWNKYIGFIKKFVVDSNAAAQEKGLEATLAFVENSAAAGKIVADVMNGIVSKCIAAPKAKTKEVAVQITLMYIEIEKHEAVQEELLKGTEAKNPKIVSACIATLTLALKEFGPKVINLKPLMKKLANFLEDRDKTVREEGKAMVVEMYRWVGDRLKQQLNTLKPVHITELEAEFGNLGDEKALPTRYLRSQKPKNMGNNADLAAASDNEDKEDGDGASIPDIDPYELLAPVDILSKLPKDFYEKIEAKKWQERKEALEVLETLVKNPKLENGDYGDVVRVLKKVISKDTNVLVVTLAGKCLAGLAAGLKKRFHPYAAACLPVILEKFREKKQTVVQALREAADAIYESVSIDLILEDTLAALENKNPAVKAETALYLARCFARTPPANLNKKMLKSYTSTLLKTLNEPDPTVRDNSAEALGTAMKLIGEKAMTPFLTDIDNLKMTKIKECADKAVILVKVTSGTKKERPNTAPAKVESQRAGKASKEKKPSSAKIFNNEKSALRQQIEQECEKRNGETAPIRGAKPRKTNAVNVEEEKDIEESEKKADDSDSEHLNEPISRIDISAQITEALLIELADKNWKVRNEALQKVFTLLNEATFIKPTIGDLPQGLALRLVDSNSKIAQAALGICETLAIAIGPPVKQHVRILFPRFLQCLGDSKNYIRMAAISCINRWGDQCGYKEFFDGEMIGDALKTGSPMLRSELWSWLAQKLPSIPVKQIPKEELFVCLSFLYANLEDRNSDVRKNAQEAVLGFMIHLSYEAMVRNTEKLKPGSRTVVIAALDKVRPNLPMKPLPKKEPSDDNIQKGSAKGAKIVKAVKSKGASSSKPSSARKKDDDIDTSPLLVVNNLKHQRVIDEQKLKVLKWNFTAPREEFVELLKDLMTAANVNRNLRANMFHSDFRYHLKAIEALTEDLPENSKALVSNLDLILKWLTLRFFDTNPSVLLKGLDYLQLVFNMLIEDQYHMLETEAASFIPYLIIKIGDPKDAVRNGVRALFKQIALVYPVSKLFSYVMEGVKSKNARQRTECLNQLGSLIENYGVSVCQPTPSAALKEVAKQIADRDNSVRNAALNCIVQAYFLQGERVFKLIGQISEKDKSLLDERIKRAAKNRPTKSASATRLSTPAVATSSPPTDDMEMDYEEEQEEEQVEPMETVPELNSPTSMQAKVPSGPFGLDMEFLQRLELSAPVKYRNPVLVEPGLLDLNESPVNVLSIPKTQMIPISPPKLLVSKSSVVSPTVSSKDSTLEQTILSMASTDLPTAIQSMNAIENLLKSHEAISMQTKEDKFIESINMQLKLLQTCPLRQENVDVSRGFRNTFLVILVFYDTGFLGKNVPFMHLKELVDQMISLLAENKLEHLHQAGTYYRVINNIMVKIIDNSNHTTIICVLIKLLHSCAKSNVPSKYEELVMKCLWKIVKTMSNWAADLDYDTILLEVHRFLKDYPTTWWRKRTSDTPLRTVKTVLHSMTRVKGSLILNHLTLINNTNESELQAYLIRLIASLKPEEVNAATKVTPKLNNVGKTPKHLSKSTRQQLAEIFKKIGSKEHMQEGLVQLYDFKLQYPDADVQPFLVKSHQFFQDFIEQGLREIDQARKNQNILSQANNQYSIETTESSAAVADEKDMMDPLYRLERLRALEAQCKVTSSQPNPP
ncbi:protein mini spindles [Monomorium pharaonis]|uniref:protein mini spindles n=1 Tax=Monomorium pharaonis TaxID=307658 RepID=UPI00063F87B1|nr:protein mini spindles [Monomorium pharaonis]